MQTAHTYWYIHKRTPEDIGTCSVKNYSSDVIANFFEVGSAKLLWWSDLTWTSIFFFLPECAHWTFRKSNEYDLKGLRCWAMTTEHEEAFLSLLRPEYRFKMLGFYCSFIWTRGPLRLLDFRALLGGGAPLPLTRILSYQETRVNKRHTALKSPSKFVTKFKNTSESFLGVKG